MKDYLLTKCISLGLEAKFIKQREYRALKLANEARTKGNYKDFPAQVLYYEKLYRGLKEHRCELIRKETRWASIAYGFLCGKKYSEIERISYIQPNWEKIEKLVLRYGERPSDELKAEFNVWKTEALAGIKEVPKGEYNYKAFMPGSLRKHLSSWVLRHFNSSWTSWNEWIKTLQPIRKKVPKMQTVTRDDDIAFLKAFNHYGD